MRLHSCMRLLLIAVLCLFYADEGSITSSGSTYKGQIYIGPLENLAGQTFVQITLDEQRYPICIGKSKNLNFPIVGRSICRQLGYTDVSSNKTVV